MKRTAVVAVCVGMLVASCGSDDSSAEDAAATTVEESPETPAPTTAAATEPSTTAAASTTDAPTTTEAAPTTEPACSRPAPSGRTDRTVEFAGLERTYILYVPDGYDGSTTKLLLNLHGSSSSGAAQFDGSKIDAVADANGFIVVAPDAGVVKALEGVEATGGVWNVPGVDYVDGSAVDPNAPDDVAFLDALIDQLEDEFCIDAVAATGTSGGGRMSSSLGCLSEKISMIAPVAGLRLPTDCAPTHGVEVVAFHGTEDIVNPYLGNDSSSWGPVTVPEAAAGWATLQQCTDGPIQTQVSESVVLDTWSGCTDGVEVRLYTVNGGGHNWPGGVDAAVENPEFAAFVGVTTQEINAGHLMWERLSLLSD